MPKKPEKKEKPVKLNMTFEEAMKKALNTISPKEIQKKKSFYTPALAFCANVSYINSHNLKQ